MINVVFRLDDPSATSDHGVERVLIEELKRRGLRATFAVVPFRLDDGEKRGVDRGNAPHLYEAMQRGTIEIAQHGYSHSLAPGQAPGRPSEFCGRPEAVQAALIEAGRDWLARAFGRAPRGFVPPWNSADAATLRALERAGFGYVASDIGNFPDYRGPLRCQPRSCGPAQAGEALAEARRLRRLDPTLVVVLHHYDFQADGFGFAAFRDLLDRVVADPLCRVLTLEQWVDNSTAREGLATLRNLLARDRAHWRLRGLYPRHCLVPRPFWRILVDRMAHLGW